MKRRTVFRVVPGRRAIGRWAVQRDGAVVAYWNLKAEAIDDATWRARREPIGQPTQLVVHGMNGRIQYEHTYGADPKRHRG